jgi:hypothetical protein
LVSKFTLENTTKYRDRFRVEILNVDDMSRFVDFHGKTYLRDGKKLSFDRNDLQSFTLARFMPPEILNYKGRCIAIDPDVFSVQDIYPLFELDLQGRSIACRRYNKDWASSVMLLDCSKLTHWRIDDILLKLRMREIDYQILMTLAYEESILELDAAWNSFDHLDENTKLLHNTNRRTQPWKTGLRRDFVYYKKVNPLLGFVSRVGVDFLLGRQPHGYVKHPDPNQETFFFCQLACALAQGYVTPEFLCREIQRRHVRPDLFKVLSRYID